MRAPTFQKFKKKSLATEMFRAPTIQKFEKKSFPSLNMDKFNCTYLPEILKSCRLVCVEKYIKVYKVKYNISI